MAESTVGHVVARISDEVELAKELEESIIPLRDTLASIRSFLKDADLQRRGQRSEGVRELVSQIRDVAYDVEDVLDEYLLKVELRRRWRAGWMDFVRSLAAFFTQICTRHDLVRRINGINRRLEGIKANKELLVDKELLSLDRTPSSSRSVGPQSPEWDELEDDVVGFDKDEETLIHRLTNHNVPRRSVVSIVGMGGLGKTTLAAKVYHNRTIKNHFGCRTWISVSQAFNARDVLKRMLRKVMSQHGEKMADMDKQDVVPKLLQCLKDERYLIVIDDIWEVEAWEGIEAALPQGQMGSRVLLTTRQAHVATYADPDTPPHELSILGRNDSWALFSKKAFQSADCCPANLKPLRETILDKCGGLPLAIVALGGILRRTAPSYDEWNKVLEHLSEELRREDRALRILALSYDVLPHHLKPCFLYFAAYPEDSKIDAQTLMRLWIAEGFTQPMDGQTMEDQAEYSLKQLIQRSMIRLAEKNKDGSIAEVRIHDLFLELARSEAKEVNFLLTRGNRDVLPPPMARRTSLSTGYAEHAFNNWSTPKLRTLLCNLTKIHQLFSSPFLESRLLRVIDLQFVGGLEALPEEIGGMAMLRYLGLRQSGIKKLPSSIGNLRNLQTFDIRDTKISGITSRFWKIRTLRHVLVDHKHFTGSLEISYFLNDLHTLEGVHSGSWVRNDGLVKVPNLRHLNLHEIGSSEEEAAALFQSLEKLKLLVVLHLDGSLVPPLVLISSEHRHLRALYLKGKMDMCKLDPTLKSKPINLPSLSTLHLERSRLKKEMITLIAALPSLEHLELRAYAYVEAVLVCPSAGFPRLTSLKLHYLGDLEELEVEDGALPCLKKLCISECKFMKMLPVGLQQVTTLQTLELRDMPTINTRIAKETGEDYPKIKHVPYVVTWAR